LSFCQKQISGGIEKMQLTFCGAAGTVTGSSYLVETNQHKFLVDCGMYQGLKEIRELNNQEFLFNPASLDFMLLTHAHVDHAGLIPKLWKKGFKKNIYATKATVDLCGIVLPDSGHIQEIESEWRNRKRLRTGDPVQEPVYTANEALSSLKLFKAQNYHQVFEPAPGIRVKFLDAGHILGSSMIEIEIDEEQTTTKLVFSGDIGQKNQPIIEDPTTITAADYLLIESTYGDRLHTTREQKVDLLRDLILKTSKSGGNLVIPAFTIGRTQDLLYHIRALLHSGAIPRIPVYIDSPMAVSVTEIYRNNPDYYDENTRHLFEAHESPFEFSDLHFIRTTEESKLLNENARGSIIISANGMCEAGRILHHLKHNLWRPESNILFVGYQAEGTLGRKLKEGARVVKIMGEEINVQAGIHAIEGFSAHADQSELLEWLGAFTTKPQVFIVHGEPAAQQQFAKLIQEQYHLNTIIPELGDRLTLKAGGVSGKEKVSTVTPKYSLDRIFTDLEHSILALHQQIRQAKRKPSESQLDGVRKLFEKLEKLVKNQD
jgi:metallo-beta-lactamase family protein